MRAPDGQTPQKPAEAGFLVLEGRRIPYLVKRSAKRRRSYGFVVDKGGQVVFSAPKSVKLLDLLDFARRRKRFIEKRLAELVVKQERALQKADMAERWCELPPEWFKAVAKKRYPVRVRYWAEQVGVSVRNIRITSGRNVWGSCNSHGDIALSWRLLLVPEPLREYVIVHEVCHRRWMNHGVRFWALVGKYVPDYVEKRRALNKLGGEIG